MLHRMVVPGHPCPFGLKSKAQLERQGYDVDDRHPTSREQAEAFVAEHGVETTPQTVIAGDDDLRIHFGRDDPDDDGLTCRPVIALFAVAAPTALAISWAESGDLLTVRAAEWSVAVAMVLSGLQKLQDVESFSIMFLNHDPPARRRVRYGAIYPYAETGAGLLMPSCALPWLPVPVALFIGTVGAASVVMAVSTDRRELGCACVGGDSGVLLGFVSLTENVMMVAVALWIWARRWDAFAAWARGATT